MEGLESSDCGGKGRGGKGIGGPGRERKGPGRCGAQCSASSAQALSAGQRRRSTRFPFGKSYRACCPSTPSTPQGPRDPGTPGPKQDQIPRQPRCCISHHSSASTPSGRGCDNYADESGAVSPWLTRWLARHVRMRDVQTGLPAHAGACDSCPPAPPLAAGSDACSGLAPRRVQERS